MQTDSTISPLFGDPRLPARFWNKIRVTPTGCWEWTGYIFPKGYAAIWVGGKGGRSVYIHRFAYEKLIGPIPNGLTIDHLCRNRACGNPGHLEAITIRENILRGVGFSANEARQTHCIHGHAFDLENTCFTRDGKRRCRACWRDYYHRTKTCSGQPNP